MNTIIKMKKLTAFYKRFLSFALCTFMLVLSCPMVVHADLGPKPSINLEFAGIEDQVYYITLLSDEPQRGPYAYSTGPIPEDSPMISDYKSEGLAVWEAFRSYQDTDGFYFLDYFSRCNEQNTYDWSYYPPFTFKVLLYFPEEQTFICSEITETYACDSYYLVTVSEDLTSLTIRNNYDHFTEIITMLVRIVLTILIETLIALLFRLRERNILMFIILLNIATQVFLNVMVNLANYIFGITGFFVIYILAELFITAFEAICYFIYFRVSKTDKPIRIWIAPVYAILANFISFLIGFFPSMMLIGMF